MDGITRIIHDDVIGGDWGVEYGLSTTDELTIFDHIG